jgi:hypothetical protein
MLLETDRWTDGQTDILGGEMGPGRGGREMMVNNEKQ